MTAICPVRVLSLGCLAGRADASRSPSRLPLHTVNVSTQLCGPPGASEEDSPTPTQAFLSAQSHFKVSEVGTNCWTPKMILLLCPSPWKPNCLWGHSSPWLPIVLGLPEFPLIPVYDREGHSSWPSPFVSVTSQLKISMMKPNGTKLIAFTD